jgi:hypothetical protein
MPSRNGFLDEALDDDIPGAELQFLGFLSDLLVGAELVEIILGGGGFFVGNVALDGIALVTRHMIKRCARTGPVFRRPGETWPGASPGQQRRRRRFGQVPAAHLLDQHDVASSRVIVSGISRVWTQLIHNLIANMWCIARKLRLSSSKRVASLRVSFVVQKKRSTMWRIR